jgi:hypothetical protein
MGTNGVFIAELILFEGGAVAWGAWELWKLRPGKTDTADEPSALAWAAPKSTPTEAASPDPPGHSEREHGADQG